jgi:hypothetical protein
LHAEMTRRAISPRFAIITLRNMLTKAFRSLKRYC